MGVTDGFDTNVGEDGETLALSRGDLVLPIIVALGSGILVLNAILFENMVLGLLLGIPIFLYAPGFFSLDLIFQGRMTTFTQRILAFPVSMGLIILTGMLSLLIWDYNVWWFTFSILGILVVVLACLPIVLSAQRRSPGLADRALPWRSAWVASRAYPRFPLIIVAVAIALFLVLILGPLAPTEPYTEFYLYGAQGIGGTIPADLETCTVLPVWLGIANHEGGDREYSLLVRTGAASSPVTIDADGQLGLGPSSRYSTTLSVNAGKEVVEPFALTLTDPGPTRVVFHLSAPGVDLGLHLNLVLSGPTCD